MLNNIHLQGRLVAAPELKHTPNQVPVATMRLAVDRDRKSSDPDAQTCDFIPVVAWRGLAEFAYRYLSRGQQVLVSGRLQMRQYTDRDGARHTVAEVVADTIHFCGPKPITADAGKPAPDGAADDGEEGLPF